MTTQKIVAYEIVNHGAEHEQYFQGCGVSHTDFEAVYTGIGANAKEAYEDALDQLATEWDTFKMPMKPRGIRASDRIPADANEEVYWYVSIRVR